MRAKSIILILIAGGCGLVASIGISQVMSRSGESGPALEMVDVLVAAHDLDIGDKLDAQSLKFEPWPKDRVPEGAMTDLESLKDHVPNTRLYEGEPILQKKLIDNLADSLPPIPDGYRVVPVKISEATAPPLLLPGDRIDILVFLRRSGDIQETQTRTVLTDVRVFAVNHQTERVVEDERSINAKTVSVLVKRGQVELLMLAMEMGSIRLSLRGHGDEDEGETTGADLNMLTNNPSDRADDDQPKVETPDALPTGGGSFAEFLNQKKQSEPEVQAVAQLTQPRNETPTEMAVHTPDGVTLYTWRNPEQLPDVRSLGAGGAPAPAPALPASMNQPAGSPPAADPAGDGYLPPEPSDEQPRDEEAADDDNSSEEPHVSE
ncbi:MAG: Flp pilus assembly protein CpaB [Pirellulaceae bacterium]